jgi:hypothetical protein
MASALHGTWRKEHLFALKQAVQMYEFYQRQLAFHWPPTLYTDQLFETSF